MNNVQLIGRLTNKPELSKSVNDKTYTRVTLAVNRQYKNKDGEKEADFISCVFWGKLAETLQSYGKKGMLLSIEGEIRAYSFDGKDKEKHYVTEVLGHVFQMLESRDTIARRESDSEPVLDAEEMPF